MLNYNSSLIFVTKGFFSNIFLHVSKGYMWWIFIGLVIIYSFITTLSQTFIFNDSLYYRSYSGTLTNQTIEGILGFQSRFWWSVYLFPPLLLLLKFLFASICINIGSMLSVIDIKFKDIFK